MHFAFYFGAQMSNCNLHKYQNKDQSKYVYQAKKTKKQQQCELVHYITAPPNALFIMLELRTKHTILS